MSVRIMKIMGFIIFHCTILSFAHRERLYHIDPHLGVAALLTYEYRRDSNTS